MGSLGGVHIINVYVNFMKNGGHNKIRLRNYKKCNPLLHQLHSVQIGRKTLKINEMSFLKTQINEWMNDWINR